MHINDNFRYFFSDDDDESDKKQIRLGQLPLDLTKFDRMT